MKKIAVVLIVGLSLSAVFPGAASFAAELEALPAGAFPTLRAYLEDYFEAQESSPSTQPSGSG